MATVEKRTKISVKDYLGFGALTLPLQTKTKLYIEYYGELNKSGYEHGRGIKIWNDGLIYIGYSENGLFSTGNFRILSDGSFQVGDIYMKDGE